MKNFFYQHIEKNVYEVYEGPNLLWSIELAPKTKMALELQIAANLADDGRITESDKYGWDYTVSQRF